LSQTIIRLPVLEPEHTHVPVGSLDVLPSRAAAAWPNRVAVRDNEVAITFAELDRKISRLASGLRGVLGGEDSVVAVSAAPHLAFPIAYYAVVRSGNVVVPVSPRLGADVLHRLLVSVRARAVVLDRALYDRARPALAVLPGLEQVLLLDGSAADPGVLTCAGLAGRGDLLVEPRDRDENEVGAIMLGGGRAGYARAARRTHHGLKRDAMRTGAAHGLGVDTVVLHALPSFPHSHLDAAVWAGTTQVLSGSRDPGVLAAQARRLGVSHSYALPGGGPAPTRLTASAVAS
jgi:long-chain acyl-CoA synthetase